MATSSDSTRFTRRQWQRRRAAARPLLLSVAAIVLIVFAGWVVFASSWLSAQTVTVSGEHTLTDAEVEAAADVDLGTPLVRLDLDALQRRVSALPAVAAVSVHRSWPQTVTITVTERQPVAAVQRDGGWAVVDKEGVPFRQTAQQPPLPAIDVPADNDQSALRAAASVADALPAHLLATVRLISAQSMDSIALELVDGRVIRWGSATESEEKAQVLAVLLRQRARVYDVSVPAAPTIAS